MIEDWRASVNGLKHANVISYAEKNSYNVTKFLIKEVFFGGESGRGGGGAKWLGELCVPLKKSWLRPCQPQPHVHLKAWTTNL